MGIIEALEQRLLDRIAELEQKVQGLQKTSVQWLTPAQAMQALGCGEKKLKSLRESGRIESRPYGTRSHRYLASSIEACFPKKVKATVLGRKNSFNRQAA